MWSHTQRQIKSSHCPSALVMRHQGLFEERGSELVQQGWLLNVYGMSDLTFGRASGWHLSPRQAWPWHFMYHVELLGGKGERGKFTYRHRQMNIAYWSAYERDSSGPAGGLLHCFRDAGSPQWLPCLLWIKVLHKCCHVWFGFVSPTGFYKVVAHPPNNKKCCQFKISARKTKSIKTKYKDQKSVKWLKAWNNKYL